MSMVQNRYPLISKDKLTEDIYSFWIDCPDLVSGAVPGQFVHVRLPGFLLRRPISICEMAKGRLRLVFQIRGAGTEQMAAMEPGSMVDLLGPLGRGFGLTAPGDRAVLVGGGIGTPPMLPLAQHYDGAAVFLGFRDADSIMLREDFRQADAILTLTTDDGSAGIPGFVTGPLERYLKSEGADILFACGPMGLLKNVQALALKYNIPAQLSLEERMACGVGACLGCAVPIRTAAGEVYRHVCKDGPVFKAEEVVF